MSANLYFVDKLIKEYKGLSVENAKKFLIKNNNSLFSTKAELQKKGYKKKVVRKSDAWKDERDVHKNRNELNLAESENEDLIILIREYPYIKKELLTTALSLMEGNIEKARALIGAAIKDQGTNLQTNSIPPKQNTSASEVDHGEVRVKEMGQQNIVAFSNTNNNNSNFGVQEVADKMPVKVSFRKAVSVDGDKRTENLNTSDLFEKQPLEETTTSFSKSPIMPLPEKNLPNNSPLPNKKVVVVSKPGRGIVIGLTSTAKPAKETISTANEPTYIKPAEVDHKSKNSNAKGPNPEYRTGPNPSLVNGPNKSLRNGPNPDLLIRNQVK